MCNQPDIIHADNVDHALTTLGIPNSPDVASAVIDLQAAMVVWTVLRRDPDGDLIAAGEQPATITFTAPIG